MRKLLVGFMVVSVIWAAAKAGDDDKSKFEVCDGSKVYRVDDLLLAARGYASAPIVETNPQFPGRVKALQKFFDEKLKLDEDARKVSGTIPVAFAVSCKGKVGDFKFIGKTFPELAQEIIKVAEKMPDWEAGNVKGKAVDTHVRLSFTIVKGSAKVSIGKRISIPIRILT